MTCSLLALFEYTDVYQTKLQGSSEAATRVRWKALLALNQDAKNKDNAAVLRAIKQTTTVEPRWKWRWRRAVGRLRRR